MWGEMQGMKGCPAQPKEAVDAREIKSSQLQETAHCLGHLARERVTKQTNPIDNSLSCEQSCVGKILGGNITYAWPVLSPPSRCLLIVTTGKRRLGAADPSESIKLLLCSPAECQCRILTVIPVSYFLCC